MAAFSTLYPLVRLHAKNAPDVTIDIALRHALREFCRKSWYLRRTITVQAVAGQAYYVLTPDSAEEEIIGIVALEYGEDYGPLRPDQREWHRYRSGAVTTYAFEPPSRLQLIPYPATTETYLPEMLVRTANATTYASTVIPDEVALEFDHTIADGAIAYLCSMPSEGWTDPNTASMANRAFNEGILTAKNKALWGHVPGGQQMVLPTFNV